jgi:predicted RNA-binding protein YlqC (UPF0109 family)
MRNLLEFILLHLVKHPDAIEVTETEMADHTEFTLKVHPEDIGRIIGRQGRTIQAIRTLAKVRAIQDNLRVRINVDDSVDETDGTADSTANETADPAVPADNTVDEVDTSVEVEVSVDEIDESADQLA